MPDVGYPGLHCWIEAEASTAIVHLEGEIDIFTRPILADTIAAAFRQRPYVIVDLSDVTSLDASGLGVFQQVACQYVGRFAVAVSRALFRRLFESGGLTEIIPLAASVDSGRKYLTTGN